ncbi:MAG TPA: cytochrome P450, partial [Kribbellaceae bacterium]
MTAPEFPMPRTCPYQPPPGYDELRAAGPVTRISIPSGGTAWAVTGYDQARALFNDSRLSVDRTSPAYPRLTSSRIDTAAMKTVQTFVDMDEPEHGVHRRMLIPWFTLRGANALRPRLRDVADELVAGLRDAGPPADLLPAFAAPLAAALFCALFGIPEADHAFFRERGCVAATDRARAGEALWDLRQYLDTHARSDRAEGLVGALVSTRVAGGELTHDQLLNMLTTLLVAGSENLANLIPLAVLTLLEHPAQLAAVTADADLLPGAVEELLRYLSIADTVPRLALAGIELGGHLIEAGDGVIIPVAAANRSAEVFAEPDTFDVRRSARQHLAFGHGVHQCLGQNLVRVVLEVALSALFDGIPSLRLAVPVERI